jgi:hypothetical protein
MTLKVKVAERRDMSNVGKNVVRLYCLTNLDGYMYCLTNLGTVAGWVHVLLDPSRYSCLMGTCIA